jgi:hypothetical protein
MTSKGRPKPLIFTPRIPARRSLARNLGQMAGAACLAALRSGKRCRPSPLIASTMSSARPRSVTRSRSATAMTKKLQACRFAAQRVRQMSIPAAPPGQRAGRTLPPAPPARPRRHRPFVASYRYDPVSQAIPPLWLAVGRRAGPDSLRPLRHPGRDRRAAPAMPRSPPDMVRSPRQVLIPPDRGKV